MRAQVNEAAVIGGGTMGHGLAQGVARPGPGAPLARGATACVSKKRSRRSATPRPRTARR